MIIAQIKGWAKLQSIKTIYISRQISYRILALFY